MRLNIRKCNLRIKTTSLPKYRKEMKGLDWGRLYDEYHENIYDTNKLEEQISALMADEEVTSKKGQGSSFLIKFYKAAV